MFPPELSRRLGGEPRLRFQEENRRLVPITSRFSGRTGGTHPEKVWNHLKHQELASHRAKTKEELKDLTRKKLLRMSKDPELIRGIFFRCCVADFFG
jgi:hypothetical protein